MPESSSGQSLGHTGFDSDSPTSVPDTTQDVRSSSCQQLWCFSWWLMLGFWGTREARVLGSGSDEYKRSLASSGWLFGCWPWFHTPREDTARGFVGLAFPAGALGLVVARWLVRQHLSIERKQGKSSSRVLIIGGPFSVGTSGELPSERSFRGIFAGRRASPRGAAR